MLSERSLAPELLDAPQTDAALVERSLGFMRWVNRHFGGVGVVRRHIAAEASRVDGPLRVLDIGTGSADIPLAVSRWARSRGLAVEFTCIESNPHCAAVARRRLDEAADPAVRLVVGDVCRHDPAATYHCAVGSMVFHHFGDDGVLRLIERLRECVTGSLLINDLRRCWPNYLACGMLAPMLSHGVRHDALLSIRRGFRVAELCRLLSRVPRATVSVARAWFFRVQAVIRFAEGSST